MCRLLRVGVTTSVQHLKPDGTHQTAKGKMHDIVQLNRDRSDSVKFQRTRHPMWWVREESLFLINTLPSHLPDCPIAILPFPFDYFLCQSVVGLLLWYQYTLDSPLSNKFKLLSANVKMQWSVWERWFQKRAHIDNEQSDNVEGSNVSQSAVENIEQPQQSPQLSHQLHNPYHTFWKPNDYHLYLQNVQTCSKKNTWGIPQSILSNAISKVSNSVGLLPAL